MSGTIAPTKLAVIVGFDIYRRGDTITDAAEIARVMAGPFAAFVRVREYGVSSGGGTVAPTPGGTTGGTTTPATGGAVTGVAGALSLNGAGILTPVVGTTAGTLAAGNDPRITNAVQQAALFDAGGLIRSGLLPAGTGSTAGTPGKSILSGNGVPAAGAPVGTVGDAYIVTGATGTGDIYDLTASGWVKRANASLRGPAGAQGLQGTPGVAGAKGADGQTPALVTPTAVTTPAASDAFFMGRGADAVSITYSNLIADLRTQLGTTGGTTPAGVAPGPVTGLTAGTATTNAVPLTWTAPTTGDAPITYTVEYRTGAAAFAAAPNSGNVTASPFTVTGLAAATSYDFRVTAKNAAGQSTPVVVSKATLAAPSIALTAPTGVVAGNSFTVTGSLNNFGTVPTVAQLTYSLDAGAFVSLPAGSAISGTTLTLAMGGLSAGSHTVAVKASDGTTSNTATFTAAAPAQTTPAAPTTAPTFAVGAATASGITLAITAQSGSDSYSLQYKRSADTSYTTVAVPASGNYTVSGLTASTAYDFRLAGVNAGGTGPYSAVQQGSTTAAATTTALATNVLDGKGFAFAYGADRLLTSHTGGAWYVRPVGGTALTTVGFVGDGSLDEAALAAVGSDVEWMGAVAQVAGTADLLVPAGVTPPRCVVGGQIVRHPGTANRPGVLWSNANASAAFADGIDLGADDATLLVVCAPTAPGTGETASSAPVMGIRPAAGAATPPTAATFGTTDALSIQADTSGTRLRGFRGNGSGGNVLAGVAITTAGTPQVAVFDVDPASMSFRTNGSTYNGSGVATAGYTVATSGPLTAAGRLLVGGNGSKAGGYNGFTRTFAGKKGALATADRDAIEAAFKTRIGA